jgi:RNA polymerase sigma-70 factor (ECF subfamily)
VVALAYVLTGSATTAEDIAQEAMTVIYRRWSRVSVMDSPGGYLRKTVANMAASGVRRRVAEAKAVLRLGSQRAPLPELPESDEQFWAAVRRLPTRQAQAAALRYIYDCPVSEVAAVMTISEGAAKAHLFRGRQALARTLGIPVLPAADGEVAS